MLGMTEVTAALGTPAPDDPSRQVQPQINENNTCTRDPWRLRNAWPSNEVTSVMAVVFHCIALIG